MRWPFSVISKAAGKTSKQQTTGGAFVSEVYIDGIKVFGMIGDMDEENYNVINLTWYASNGQPIKHERIVRT